MMTLNYSKTNWHLGCWSENMTCKLSAPQPAQGRGKAGSAAGRVERAGTPRPPGYVATNSRLTPWARLLSNDLRCAPPPPPKREGSSARYARTYSMGQSGRVTVRRDGPGGWASNVYFDLSPGRTRLVLGSRSPLEDLAGYTGLKYHSLIFCGE